MVYYTLILISRYILYAKCLIWNSFLLGNIIHIILDHLEYVLIIYVNNCPTRCKTKQSIYYSASSLYNVSKLAWPRCRGVDCTKKKLPVLEAVVTFLCSPDDGCV